MVDICLYFQVHHPYKLNNFRVFDIGYNENYFNDDLNRDLLLRSATQCYIPANKILLDLIKQYQGKFKVTFSISGTAIEHFEKYNPHVLESFKELAQTGCVEFLAETYYHSLSFLYSKQEFARQIELHKELVKKHFNQEPKVFRNTELIYSNSLAQYIEELGFEAVLADNAHNYLEDKNPNFIYTANTGKKHLKILTKNTELSENISENFNNPNWVKWPLTASTYANMIEEHSQNSNIINLFMNYTTFGEKFQKDTNILKFLSEFPQKVLENPHNNFITPSQAIRTHQAKTSIDIPFLISWKPRKDFSHWSNNKMQETSIKEVFMLEKEVKSTKDKYLIQTWRKLTSSEHFEYMCTQDFTGCNQNHLSSHETPYDGYISFMNILNDLIVRIKLKKEVQKTQAQIHKEPPKQKGILKSIKVAVKS